MIEIAEKTTKRSRKKSVEAFPQSAPPVTDFGKLAEAMNSPTSSIGILNRSKEFMEGYEASRRGVIRARNPYGYPATSTEAVDWEDGWTVKFHGEAL
jgi:hypothetical protein